MASDPIADAHDMARAQYGKISGAHSTIAALRGAMDRLMKLGDMVQPEDVIDEAGKLLGHSGLTAVGLAKFLSTMPEQGGQPLMGWLSAHEAPLAQAEMESASALGVARHRMGVAALHELAAHSLRQGAARRKAPQASALAGGAQAPAVPAGSTLAITSPQSAAPSVP